MNSLITWSNNRIPIDKIDSVSGVFPCPYGYSFLIYTKEYPIFCDIIIKDTREEAVTMRDTVIEAMMEVE